VGDDLEALYYLESRLFDESPRGAVRLLSSSCSGIAWMLSQCWPDEPN